MTATLFRRPGLLRALMTALLLIGALCGVSITSIAQIPTADPRAAMENPRNPLLHVSSSHGDLYLELFPTAAPQNVQRVLDLATADSGYYDNLTFHRTVPDLLIQFGAPERAGRERPATPVPDEINARGLGLEQQAVLDEAGLPHTWLNISGLDDFQQKVLKPLYEQMGITSDAQLQQRQNDVLQRLRDMNLLQAYENMGYRYDGSLPSRRPLAGSVLMANYGPASNDGELLILLADAPWLTGTHTVIGRVASGLENARLIARSPDSSVRLYQLRLFADTPREDVLNNGQATP